MVKRALEGLPGVERASVSFGASEARVAFDPARVSVDALIRAVDQLGFRAWVKREEGKAPGPSAKPPGQ